MYVASDYDDVYAADLSVRFFFVYLDETMINHAPINAISLRPVWVYNLISSVLSSLPFLLCGMCPAGPKSNNISNWQLEIVDDGPG